MDMRSLYTTSQPGGEYFIYKPIPASSSCAPLLEKVATTSLPNLHTWCNHEKTTIAINKHKPTENPRSQSYNFVCAIYTFRSYLHRYTKNWRRFMRILRKDLVLSICIRFGCGNEYDSKCLEKDRNLIKLNAQCHWPITSNSFKMLVFVSP